MAATNRTEKTAQNAFVSLMAQVLVIFFNFIGRTIFVHFFSAEYLGINGLFGNILTVLSFAELGIGEAMVYAMYKPMKECDTDKLCALMNLYRKAYWLIAVIVGILGIILSFFLEVLVPDKLDSSEYFQFIFLIYLANTVASYCLTYKKSILFVDLKRYIAVYFQIAFSFIQLLLQWLIIAATRSFILYLIVQVVCTVLSNVSVSVYVNQKYKNINDKTKKLDLAERRSIFNNVKSLAVIKIAGVVGSGTDNIIASKIIGLTVVGLVSNYTLIINAINGLLWSILYGLTNSIGDFNVDSNVARRRNTFDELYLCSFIVFCVIGTCIVSLINPFIEMWIGHEFVVSETIAYALVLTIFLGGLNYAAYSFRITLGIFKEVQWFYVAYTTLNIVLSILWGKTMGIFGIFLATTVSRLFTAEVADGYYVSKRCLERNPLIYYLKDIVAIATFTFLCFVSTRIVGLSRVNGLLGFAIKGAVSITINSGGVLLVVAWFPEFGRLKDRIARMLKRKQ